MWLWFAIQSQGERILLLGLMVDNGAQSMVIPCSTLEQNRIFLQKSHLQWCNRPIQGWMVVHR